jgi:hypothetical protein
MIYTIKPGQSCQGEPVGILLLDTCVPFIPGDVANATTYDFPVRFKKVEGFSAEKALNQDPDVYDSLLAAAEELIAEGVRGLTGDCGFMGIFQNRLAEDVDVPVFLSSMIQIELILRMIGGKGKLGIVTADSSKIGPEILREVGVINTDRLVFGGLQDKPHFVDFGVKEIGILDTDLVVPEIIKTAKDLVASDPRIKALLLECSLLPPHAHAIQKAVSLPVFDFISLINYVFSGIQTRTYSGYM